MAPKKNIIIARVEYLQSELEALKDYYYVPETYDLLIRKLDENQVLLKEIECADYFASLDAAEVDV